MKLKDIIITTIVVLGFGFILMLFSGHYFGRNFFFPAEAEQEYIPYHETRETAEIQTENPIEVQKANIIQNMSDFKWMSMDLGDEEFVLEEALEPTVDVAKEIEVVEAHLPQVVYGVAGKYMDGAVYDYLVSELRANGIEWWLTYAVCEAFQESGFNTQAKAPHGDGFDCGLFQYYDKYWESKCRLYGIAEWPNSIFDPYVQIQIYCKEFASRLQDATIEQALSDHYTGGQGYYEKYVNDVLQWKELLTTK